MARLRGTLMMNIAPVALAAALLFALAPPCTMPECSGSVGLAGAASHSCENTVKLCGSHTADSSCESYMMVDDTPDGVPAPQPPILAVTPVDSIDLAGTVSAYPYIPSTDVPVAIDDPLGTRLRI